MKKTNQNDDSAVEYSIVENYAYRDLPEYWMNPREYDETAQTLEEMNLYNFLINYH